MASSKIAAIASPHTKLRTSLRIAQTVDLISEIIMLFSKASGLLKALLEIRAEPHSDHIQVPFSAPWLLEGRAWVS